MHAHAVVKAMAGEEVIGVIPRELMRTNRIMERWAVSSGNGLPTDRWDDSRVARAPPLDDHTQCVIDRIVQHSPPRTRRIIVEWFTRPLPTREIARQMGMTQRSLEKGLRVVLYFLMWKFECSRHPTLMRLLKAKVED